MADVGVSAKKVTAQGTRSGFCTCFFILYGFTGFYLTSLPSTFIKYSVYTSLRSRGAGVVCGVGESYNYANFKGKAQLSRDSSAQ